MQPGYTQPTVHYLTIWTAAIHYPYTTMVVDFTELSTAIVMLQRRVAAREDGRAVLACGLGLRPPAL